MRRKAVKATPSAAPTPRAPAAPNAPLIDGIRRRFLAHADAANAAPMQSYMKSSMAFHGINAPLRRRLCAEAVKEHPCGDEETLRATMEVLWRGAKFREEWYAAQELPRVGPHRKLSLLPLLPLYEEMIERSAWWDCCDDISGNALPALMQAHPTKLRPLLKKWAHGDSLWLRRAAILAQRRLRANADAALLYECIEASVDDARFNGEFFINKGIGWALRERSYTHPAEVSAYVARNAHRLAPLTRREALKVIERRARATADSDGAPDEA